MTLEIDCTTRTKQKSTLSVETLYRTRVRMLGPTLVPSDNSIVRTVIVTRKLQSLAATAAACEVLLLLLLRAVLCTSHAAAFAARL